MKEFGIAGICIEHVAEKLRALRALEYPRPAHQLANNPRLAEVLLFIQWMSHQPGGIERAVSDRLIEPFADRIGTSELFAAETTKAGRFASLKVLLDVWNSIKRSQRRLPAELTERRQGYEDSLNLWLDEEPSQLRTIEREAGPHYREILQAITPDYCRSLCIDAARKQLPGFLASLCNEIDHSFPETGPWYFGGLLPALFEMMDRHAKAVLAGIARTQVAELIFDELDFAASSAVPVFIAGDSRYGKTVAHKTWCHAYPGRARLISAPPTWREWDFFAAHADALGVPYSTNSGQRKIARDVQFVIKHTGLFLCYDEAHHLLPARVTRTSKPWRMDWIRCHVLDVGTPAAFIATRQTYGQSLAQFVKVTHHQMEQWFDRMNRPLVLPAEISRADVLAVAAHNFPHFTKCQLEKIASAALKDDSAFHAVNLLAKRAAYLARKAGRAAIDDEDVRLAIEEWKRRPIQRDFENPHKAPDAPDEPAAVVLPETGSRRAAAPPPDVREISPVSLPAGRSSLHGEEAPVLAD